MWYRKMLIASFMLLLVFIPAATFLLPKQAFSDWEDRAMALPPRLSAQSLLDGSYGEEAEAFLADHMVFRLPLAKARAKLSLLGGKREIDGVLVGKSRLMKKISSPEEDYTSRSVAAINAFTAKYQGWLEVSVMLVPTAAEFYPEEVPYSAQLLDQTQYIQDFYGGLSHVSCVDAYTPLAAEAGNGIFYRTDYRWTTFGAYVGYTALAKALGYRAAATDMFNIEHAAHDYLGDLYVRALAGEEWKDTVDLYTYASADVVRDVVRDNGKNTVTYSSIFFREALSRREKYEVFLGGDAGVVHIRTNVGNGKKLLIFNDDFANPMTQFLPLHYDEIALVDLESFDGELSDYLNVREYQQALFLLSMDSVSSGVAVERAANF